MEVPMDDILAKFEEWGSEQLSQAEGTPKEAGFREFLTEVRRLRPKARDLYHDRVELLWDVIRLVQFAMDNGLTSEPDVQRTDDTKRRQPHT